MSLWLALDTASARATVAVVDVAQRRVVAERGLDVPRRHAESIAGACDACLDEAGIGFDALSGFAAGVGPGSFVGVRVAIATAKGFSLARSRPLVGFCSLAALGGHAQLAPGRGLALIDARRGEVYARVVDHRADGTLAVDAPVVAVTPKDALALLPSPAFLVGSGAHLCATSDDNASNAVVHDGVVGPDGAGMLAALLARPTLHDVDEAAGLVPNYCRAPDAKRIGE